MSRSVRARRWPRRGVVTAVSPGGGYGCLPSPPASRAYSRPGERGCPRQSSPLPGAAGPLTGHTEQHAADSPTSRSVNRDIEIAGEARREIARSNYNFPRELQCVIVAGF